MANEPIVSASSGPESLPDRRSLLVAIVILVLGIAIIAVASDAFLDFAAQLKANNSLIRNLDQGVHDWCVTHRNHAGNIFFVIITTLGSPLILSVVTAIVVIVKWRKHQRGTACFLALATSSITLAHASAAPNATTSSAREPSGTDATEGARRALQRGNAGVLERGWYLATAVQADDPEGSG